MSNVVKIWTDGASRGNPGPGGYGVVLTYVDSKGETHRKEMKEAFLSTTNNKMEVLAAVMALKELKGSQKVILTSDSKYLVNAFNEGWIKKWMNENFRIGKKDEVKNIELWKELIDLVSKHDVTFNWVKGHNDDIENERCDKLANEAMDELIKKGA